MWLSTKEAAARAGIPLTSLRALISRGAAPYHYFGPRTRRFNQDDLDLWIAQRRISAVIDSAMTDQAKVQAGQ